MPRDIRSYFTAGPFPKTKSNESSSRTKKRRIISSDEEETKIESPVKRTKKTKKSEKHFISSDSNDEEKPKKMVSPGDMFGKKLTKRQEAPKVNKTSKNKEAKIHDDAEFEATLSQLDTSDIEKKYLEADKSDKVNDSIIENKKEDKSKTENGKEKQKKSPIKRKAESRDASKDRPKTSQYELVVEKKKEEKHTPETPAYEPELIKKQKADLYKKYLERGGARNPGSKPIPDGAEYCLAGLSFVITGVLTSLEKEEAAELVKKYGGRILHQVSGKTDYLVVGEEPGPSKLHKATQLHVKQISEDDLLDLIRTRPAGKATDIKQSAARGKGKQQSLESDGASTSPPKTVNEVEEKKKTTLSPVKKQQSPPAKKASPVKTTSPSKKDIVKDEPVKVTQKTPPQSKAKLSETEPKSKDLNEAMVHTTTEALVEKYRPKTMKQILGQQTDKSNARKLYKWLSSWHKNQSGTVKLTKPSPWAQNDDGSYYKAALLSGPPGVGKTTTVQVVCNELGFDLVEFNASDTRSKRLLKEEVAELLNNTSLKGYFTDSKTKPSSKHVLLMDEVDGMAGNEDRGGLQELISLIKSTDVPVVCICNDRNNPKMRTLSNYTFDLRFSKPRIEQIRGAMKSICFKEKIDISTEDLDRLIESTNQDIRQVINHLALFVGNSAHQQKSEKKHINKDLKLGPWDVIRKVFSAEEHKNMSIHDKSDLFFHDYSIAPLFVQENYPIVVPRAPREELLDRVAQCADSLVLGDMVERAIRSNNAWSLLPTQACYSCVIPGTVMSGHIGGQINFPSWLGRNSKTNKFDRLLQEITVHTRLTTGASKEAINLDYITPLRNAIVRPLAVDGNEGVETAVNVMSQYHLLREDLDSLIELTLWPGQRDPMQSIDSKTKAAFTRAYNKDCVALPYSVTGTTAKKKTQAAQNDAFPDEEEDDGNSDDDDNDNVETDKMIKAKKPSTSKKAESKTESKGGDVKKGQKGQKTASRGRGRGKTK